ncbi:MAG: polysaccharide deacetylase family protein [bacterium]|nr:polysaccharide deacetylase family protein [bacterium]
MILLRYKNELFKFFIYIFALLVAIFILSNILIKDDIPSSTNVEKTIIQSDEDGTNVYVEYPRFKNDEINSIITDYLYSYIKEFKSNEKKDKVLDITYQLFYIDNFVNITFHIENTLNNIKNKNILIDLNNSKLAYITQIYDEEYLKTEINDLVYYKYSSEIYEKIQNSTINNFTYILSESKIEVYFNDIEFDNIDYIPYIEILIDSSASSLQNTSLSDKYIAFTYDDGPSQYTKDLLKTLELNNSSATFFMLGNRMKKYEDTVLEIYNSNSEVGSHSYAHKDLTKLSKLELDEDLKKTNDIFNSITNDNLKYLRPPYNYSNQNVLDSGYLIVTWNIDPKDWLLRDSIKIYNNVITHVCDGCIVIMHDIYEPTIEATKMLLPKLDEMGYKVVSVSELMKIKNYTATVNKTITSIK